MQVGEAGFCNYLYQGQTLDTETGLAYNRFRYYATEEGMYISQDPIRTKGGLKFYGYVHDTSIQIDPSGLEGYTPEELDRLAKDAHSTLPSDGRFDAGNLSTTAVGTDANNNLYVASSLPKTPEELKEWAAVNNATVIESGKSNIHAEEALHNADIGIENVGSSRPICIDCENGMRGNQVKFNENNTSGKKSKSRKEGGKNAGSSGCWH